MAGAASLSTGGSLSLDHVRAHELSSGVISTALDRQRPTSTRAPFPPTTTHRSCMLGLRPRLKARPSFLDLVRRGSIDQISQRPAHLEADARPLLLPLPQSPVLAPQEPAIVVSPSPQNREDQSREIEVKEDAKMGPVSCAVCRGVPRS